MKKNYVLIFAAGLVLLATACNKNEVDGQSATQEKEAVVTYIKATAKEDDTKASIDNSTGDFTWNTGDQIAVWADGYKISEGLADAYDGTNAATFSFKGLDESKRANFAIYPADFANSTYYTDTDLRVNLPSSYTLAQVRDNVSPLPMIATNVEDGNLSFKQLCALLRVTVNNIPPSAKRLELNFHDNKVHGSFTVTLDEGIVKPAISTIATEGSSANDIITITKDGTDVTLNNNAWLDNLVLNIPIPVGTYTKVTVTAYDALTFGNAILTMTRPIKVSEDWTATRANARKCIASLPAFSVSDSKRVVIARSNLKCTTEDNWKTWSWSFMENPWDIVETTNLAKANYEGATAIGLFCWGTSGHSAFSSDSHYGQYWQPYNTTNSYTDYGPIDNREGVIYNYKDLTDETYKYGDWGVEAGSIEGYNTWRTPTHDEYLYLFGLKNDNAKGEKSQLDAALASSDSDPDYRYSRRVNNWGIGKVNEVIGMIIVPDHFVDPTGSFSFGYMQPKSSSAPQPLSYENTFSEEGWKPMEAAGAIFMPVAGVRSGTSFTNSRSARYWTSSMNKTIGNANANFECPQLGFNEYLYNLRVVSENRGTGRAVRLVRDLN